MTRTAIPVTLILLALSCLSSCRWNTSNPYMAVETPRQLLAQVPGKATVIFKKERFGYYSASLWDVTVREQPSLVAVLSAKMKAAHFIRPGTYFFMSVNGGQRSLIRVTAVAEATYCVYFRGHSFVPIQWGGTNPGEPTDFSVLLPTANEWANQPNTRESMKRHVAKAYSSWSQLSKEERKQFVLAADQTCQPEPTSK